MDVHCSTRTKTKSKLLIIDLYGDGESLRGCDDKPGVDQIITEFKNDVMSDGHFDEFMERNGVELFITRRVSLDHIPEIVGISDSVAITD